MQKRSKTAAAGDPVPRLMEAARKERSAGFFERVASRLVLGHLLAYNSPKAASAAADPAHGANGVSADQLMRSVKCTPPTSLLCLPACLPVGGECVRTSVRWYACMSKMACTCANGKGATRRRLAKRLWEELNVMAVGCRGLNAPWKGSTAINSLIFSLDL